MTRFHHRDPSTGEGPHKIARSAGLVVLLAVLTTPVAGLAGLVTKPAALWYVSRSPKLRVDVAAGCPASVSAYQDVVNTFPGPPLVPPRPDGAIVCRYLGPSCPRQLALQTRLDEAEAQLLSEAVRRLSLRPPEGVYHVPGRLQYECPDWVFVPRTARRRPLVPRQRLPVARQRAHRLFRDSEPELLQRFPGHSGPVFPSPKAGYLSRQREIISSTRQPVMGEVACSGFAAFPTIRPSPPATTSFASNRLPRRGSSATVPVHPVW